MQPNLNQTKAEKGGASGDNDSVTDSLSREQRQMAEVVGRVLAELWIQQHASPAMGSELNQPLQSPNS